MSVVPAASGPKTNVFGEPIPDGPLLNPGQQKVLVAFGDALFPPLKGQEAQDALALIPATATAEQRRLAPEYIAKGFSDLASDVIPVMERLLMVSGSPALVAEIKLLLTVLSTRAGTMLFTGHPTPFAELDPTTRQSIIKGWRSSRVPLLRKVGTGLSSITYLSLYRFTTFAPAAVGYPQTKPEDFKKFRPAQGPDQEEVYPYTFLNATLPASGTVELETEVLVIGSGSGGSVAAAHIANAGLAVVVVDKGIYLDPSSIDGDESGGYRNLYDREGSILSDNGGVAVIAGSTFGGGSTINWSACLKPRTFARRAWTTEFGVPYFSSPQFTADLNTVCERMGASTAHTHHNLANSLLALGSQRSGMEVSPVPQNSGVHAHYCGKCQYGCPSNEKQGATNTWLKDAAQAGTQFLTSTTIDRVLFEDASDPKRATGALGSVGGRPLKIRATKAVVVAGGSMQTPAVLLRTPELKSNKVIGHHLHLHPVTIVVGLYDFPVDPWEGGLLTMVNNAAELVDSSGWGAKVEVIASSPSYTAALMGLMGAEHKKVMLRYKHSFAMLVLTRDRDGGQVYVDSQGRMNFSYSTSPHDQKSLTVGAQIAADVHLAAGASQIITAQPDVDPFVVTPEMPSITSVETSPVAGTTYPVEAVQHDASHPSYVAWRKTIGDKGFRPMASVIGSAHQMSSCRMSRDPRKGATDPLGRVYGAKGLYVADASLMPEASGVNPMVTTMACAKHAARTVVTDAQGKKEFGQPAYLTGARSKL